MFRHAGSGEHSGREATSLEGQDEAMKADDRPLQLITRVFSVMRLASKAICLYHVGRQDSKIPK